MAEDAANPKRAIDLGPVDAAVLASGNGRARLRLYLSVEQLETMLAAARSDADKRSVTQCDAKSQRREDTDSEVAAVTRAREDRASVWVSEGTRAWKAWENWRRQARAGRAIPVTKRVIDGKTHTGWWFVSLFPPTQAVEFDESEETFAGSESYGEDQAEKAG